MYQSLFSGLFCTRSVLGPQTGSLGLAKEGPPSSQCHLPLSLEGYAQALGLSCVGMVRSPWGQTSGFQCSMEKHCPVSQVSSVALFLTLPLSLGELFLHLLSCREGTESCELVWGARFLRPAWQQHLLLVGNCKGKWIWETRAGPAESSCPSFYTGRFSPLPTSESQGRFYFRCWHSARRDVLPLHQIRS